MSPLVVSKRIWPRKRRSINADSPVLRIDYAVTRSIVLHGEGRPVETEVTANTRGTFSTREIPARVESLFGGTTDYRITVTAIARDGAESEPATVYARRPD
jgi:hypothetical protein